MSQVATNHNDQSDIMTSLQKRLGDQYNWRQFSDTSKDSSPTKFYIPESPLFVDLNNFEDSYVNVNGTEQDKNCDSRDN